MMFHSFLGKLHVLWHLALTRLTRPQTIKSQLQSVKQTDASRNIMPTGTTEEKAHKSITVVCACITKDNGQKVLLSLREAPDVPGLDGKWELPGGKIEFGETPEQAVVREIEEELGVKVVPKRLLPYLHTNLWEYAHAIQHVVLACYECEIERGNLKGDVSAHWFDVNQIDFRATLPGTKEFVSLAVHDEWFDKVYIEFACSDSSTDSRWFSVATQPTLYSRYGLVKYWGKLGVASRSKIEECESPTDLDERIFETARRRLSDGYHIRVLKGPEHSPEVLYRIVELAKKKTSAVPPLVFVRSEQSNKPA